METFTKLFGSLLIFVYHCFDRVVINGYLSGLFRPEQVVHFVRTVLGIPVVSKEVLSQRTNDYQRWVEAFARNHSIPIEWAGKGVRKGDYVFACAAPHGEEEGFRRLLRLQEHGAGPDISDQRAEVSHAGSRLSPSLQRNPGASDQPLHPLLLLYPGRGAGADHHSDGIVLPLPATYWLNGHSFMERELKRNNIGFHKNDNAFLAVDDVAALQAAADRLSPLCGIGTGDRRVKRSSSGRDCTAT